MLALWMSLAHSRRYLTPSMRRLPIFRVPQWINGHGGNGFQLPNGSVEVGSKILEIPMEGELPNHATYNCFAEMTKAPVFVCPGAKSQWSSNNYCRGW